MEDQSQELWFDGLFLGTFDECQTEGEDEFSERRNRAIEWMSFETGGPFQNGGLMTRFTEG